MGLNRTKQLGEACSHCKRTDVTFHKNCPACKSCHSKKGRNGHLRRKYGLSTEAFAILLIKQNGGCAICGTTDWGSDSSPCVDHDHTTGEVRGLLCRKCNVGIGQLRDNPALLANAMRYLENQCPAA